MKTKEEVENLKFQWTQDAIWDLEITEGFEEHHQELLSYRLEKEKQWHDDYEKRIEHRAVELGISGDIVLLEYILNLEARIRKLEEKIK